jgi:hypothetical protein
MQAVLEVPQVLGHLTLRNACALGDFVSRELLLAQQVGDALACRVGGTVGHERRAYARRALGAISARAASTSDPA